MADSKLSELTYATGAVSSDLLYIVQGGSTSKKIAVSSLARSLSTAMTTVFVLPVLTSTSNAVSTTGSVFIHSVENVVKYYTGTAWNNI